MSVYIREAHPSNAWQMASNVRDNGVFADPENHPANAAA